MLCPPPNPVGIRGVRIPFFSLERARLENQTGNWRSVVTALKPVEKTTEQPWPLPGVEPPETHD